MKKIIFIFLFLSRFGFVSHSQIAFVDTKYILNKMPDYRDGEKKIDKIGMQLQKEVDDKQGILDKMNKNYESEQAMLSDELKKKWEDELLNKEKEIRDLQRKYFGQEGELFKKNQELIKPIQDKVYSAIQKIAINKKYTFVLDKSAGNTVMFSLPTLDISEEVIAELGIK